MCSPRTRHVHSPDTILLFLKLGRVFLQVFRCSHHYHSTNIPYPVVHLQLTLLPTLNNCRNWHCHCCKCHCHPNKGCFPLLCLQHLWVSLHSYDFLLTLLTGTQRALSPIQAGLILRNLFTRDFTLTRLENLHHFSNLHNNFWFNVVWHTRSVATCLCVWG